MLDSLFASPLCLLQAGAKTRIGVKKAIPASNETIPAGNKSPF
jgi:hypothetical protein